jgi:NAD dependent epimerase/dehydratase
VKNQFWNGRKVLVTGAGGFIGSHLCEVLLKHEAKVTALVHYDTRADHSNLEFMPAELKANLHVVAGDICDPFFVNSLIKGQDTVFHLAALIAIPYSYVAPQSYVRTNIEGTINVLEACRTHGTRRMIHTSTSETYGTAQYAPIDEKHPLQGQSPYSASKIGADKIVESYFRSFGLAVTTLRPFNTYGPRQSARAVIPTIISQALSDHHPKIMLGDLTPIRDMNFVLDTADAFLAVAEHDVCLGQTLNTGTGLGFSIGEIAEKILSILDSSKIITTDDSRVRPANSEVFKLISNSSLLRTTTGWAPKYDLSQGLRASIDHIKTNLHRFRVGEYAI